MDVWENIDTHLETPGPPLMTSKHESSVPERTQFGQEGEYPSHSYPEGSE